MKRGDVVLMVVPGELGPLRPGIIVQGDELGENTTTILACPLSSDVAKANPRLRPIVEPTPENGLRLRSQIMTDKILASRRDRLRRVLGAIDANTAERLDSALLVALGLAR